MASWELSFQSLHAEEFADGGQAAAHAHQNARTQEYQGHEVPDVRKRHNVQDLQAVGGRDALGHRHIQQPLKAEGDNGAQRAQQQPFVHEGPADEAVGRAHHFHDGDLIAAVEGGELDGVGDDEHRHQQQYGDKGDGDDPRHVADGNEAVGHRLIGAGLGDARHLLHRVAGGHDLIRVGDMDHVAVAEHLRQQVAVHALGVVFGHVGIPCLGAGHEGAVLHVVHGLHLGLERTGLILVQRLVHKSHDSVLLLQVGQVLVGVVGHQGERTHDEQASHGDADGGKGHEAVGEHIPRAFLDKKLEIVLHRSHLIAAHAVTDDAPLVEQDDTLVEMVHQSPLVGDDDHRRAQGVDALQQRHDLQRAGRVEVAGGLVRHDGAGVVHQRPGDGHALLFAAGQLVGIAAALVRKAHQCQDVGDAASQLLRLCAHCPHGQGQVVVHRLVGDEAEILKDHADGAAHIGYLPLVDAAHGEAVDHDPARRGDDLAGEQLDDGGLARPGRAHQEGELAVLHCKGNALEGVRPVFVYLFRVYQTNHSSAPVRQNATYCGKMRPQIPLYINGYKMATGKI